MPKDRCFACGKPIENLDFYFTYPNGKICSACIMKKDYGIKEPSLLIGPVSVSPSYFKFHAGQKSPVGQS